MSRAVAMFIALLLAPATSYAAEPEEDFEPPLITVTTPNGVVDGWSAAPFDATVRVTDTGGSGIASTEYSLSGATEGNGSIIGSTAKNLPITGLGRTTLAVTSTDRAGNESNHVAELGVDTIAPSIMLGPNLRAIDGATQPVAQHVVVDFQCVDADSGIASCTAAKMPGEVLDTTAGPKELVITARDNVGRESQYTVSWNLGLNQFTLTSPLGYQRVPSAGGVIKVIVPQFSPTPDLISYQWLRNGVAIPGANDSSYLLPLDSVGAQISYQARPHKNGYSDGPFTSSPVTIQSASAPAVSYSGTTKLTGFGHVGQQLNIEWMGSYTPAEAQVRYRWYRDNLETPIEGARSTGYRLTAADLGHQVIAVVEASAAGYEPLVKTLTSSPIVAGEFTGVGMTDISGELRVGQVLVGSYPEFDLAPELRFQWQRDGEVIAGATGISYRLRAADVGAQIQFVVTAIVDGYRPNVSSSAPSTRVTRAKAVLGVAAKSLGARKVRFSLAARADGVNPRGQVVVKRNGRVLRTATLRRDGTVVVTLAKQAKGKQTYTFLYAGSAEVAPASYRVKVRVR